MAAGIVVILIAILVYFILPDKAPSNVTQSDILENNQNKLSEQGKILIQSFLKENNWKDSNMDNFLQQWNLLTQEELDTALESTVMSQLTSAIYKQILEERALFEITNAENALKKQQILLAFAKQLGIQDSRLVSAEKFIPENNNSDLKIETPQFVNASECRVALLNSPKPYCRDNISQDHHAPTMVAIPLGKFSMGGESIHAQPRHEVIIDTPFFMSVHEITYEEYLLFCEDTEHQCPTQPWTNKDYPVVNVNWYDAIAYTEWLSLKTGQNYRLPSESEWEYAARAGTQTRYPSGDTLIKSAAVYSSNTKLNAPLPKTDRSIKRNKFLLYHMAGNVREWVQDNWHDNYNQAPTDGSAWTNGNETIRVVRGGSYFDTVNNLSSGARIKKTADEADNYTGFRVIREL